MQFKAIIGGEPINGTLNQTVDGRIEAIAGNRSYTFQAVMAEPGIYWVQWNDRSLEIVVVPFSEGYAVSVDGIRLQVEIENSRSALRRRSLRGHDGTAEIKAPMPGKIVRVLAPEGSAVQANQGIVIMEAMKMQNEIKSPKAGTVKRLCVGEGAAVNSGDLLATVE